MTISPVTLYGLALEKEQNTNFGPYPWKTAVDLGTLGVPFEFEGRTFAEIRTSLGVETGIPAIMVPVIKDGERWIHDSFALAQHIEEKYATGERTLFPGSEAFARFLSTWADKDLANEIIPFLAPWMYQAQNAESSAWFLKQKIGNNKAKMECMIEAVKDPKFVESQTAAIRGKLATMEQYLDENKRAGKGRFLAGTDYPSHADATVWGWYATTVAVRPKELELESRTWKHESLPLVSAWVEAVKEGSGIKLEYLH